MLRSLFESVRFAFRGLGFVWRGERSFRIEAVLSVVALVAAVWFGFSFLELLLVLFAVGIVLGAEVFNTVVEEMLDIVQPNHDPRVGKTKDMMAAAVLLATVGGVLLYVFTVLYHLERLR